MIPNRAFLGLSLAVLAVLVSQYSASGQTVSVRDGNVFVQQATGTARQLTSSGLDSDPSLSFAKTQVVFVRTTPDFKVFTGRGDQDRNELWITNTDGAGSPRRILRGHQGKFPALATIPVGGFSEPQFSADGKRVYFVTAMWATSDAIYSVDVDTGRLNLLYSGVGVEVIRTGTFAGYLIAQKEVTNLIGPRGFRYCLLDADGQNVGEIGYDLLSLEMFREMYGAGQKP